jgi:hypothetical protein
MVIGTRLGTLNQCGSSTRCKQVIGGIQNRTKHQFKSSQVFHRTLYGRVQETQVFGSSSSRIIPVHSDQQEHPPRKSICTGKCKNDREQNWYSSTTETILSEKWHSVEQDRTDEAKQESVPVDRRNKIGNVLNTPLTSGNYNRRRQSWETTKTHRKLSA